MVLLLSVQPHSISSPNVSSTPPTSTGFTVPGWAVSALVTIFINIALAVFYQGKQDGRITAIEERQTKTEKRMDAYDAHRQEELAGYERDYKQRTQQEVAQMQVLIKNLLELQQAKTAAK